jgi:hypothetical protein
VSVVGGGGRAYSIPRDRHDPWRMTPRPAPTQAPFHRRRATPHPPANLSPSATDPMTHSMAWASRRTRRQSQARQGQEHRAHRRHRRDHHGLGPRHAAPGAWVLLPDAHPRFANGCSRLRSPDRRASWLRRRAQGFCSTLTSLRQGIRAFNASLQATKAPAPERRRSAPPSPAASPRTGSRRGPRHGSARAAARPGPRTG